MRPMRNIITQNKLYIADKTAERRMEMFLQTDGPKEGKKLSSFSHVNQPITATDATVTTTTTTV